MIRRILGELPQMDLFSPLRMQGVRAQNTNQNQTKNTKTKYGLFFNQLPYKNLQKLPY